VAKRSLFVGPDPFPVQRSGWSAIFENFKKYTESARG
jgi:hypothetical protein